MRIRTTYGPPLPGELAAQLARAIALAEIVGAQHRRADDNADTGQPTSAHRAAMRPNMRVELIAARRCR
ncbi:hypothetical protein [Rhodococcus sovatensis]|uniref:Acyl-CoA carboxylase epsilon subunit n=1 Tax=Rhodococcus sovatensis TaxID=1805840 RepID=A0ABZ2PM22_9NOCA